MQIITTIAQAVAAVEAAAWGPDNSGLSGSDIWGVHGSFAAPRATSHYTYSSALTECEHAGEKFAWRTDAASGHISADSVDAVVARLVTEREWDAIDSEREEASIEAGSWLLIHDADGGIVFSRGETP